MNRWDHFDVIVTVGLCATIFGAGVFFFAFGGAPSGFVAQWFVDTAPTNLDQNDVAQAALGQAIMDAERIRQLEGTPWGMNQERLGGAIVAAMRAEQSRAGLMPYFHDEARASLYRMQGMIQENAGRSVIAAAQRLWRDGGTGTAQIKFQEALGRIVADMSAKERAAIPQRQETLGWTIVGRLLAVDGYRGHSQQQLGSAVRDAGVMTAMLERERPVAQESLGAAVLVASAVQEATLSGNIPTAVTASTPGVVGFQASHEVPYAAGVLLLAGFFIMVWGLRSVAESGPSLPTYGQPRAMEDEYRKAG